MQLGDYMTAQEAMVAVGCSYHTLMRARRRGLISGEQKGWQYFFHRDEVERFKQARNAAIAAGVVSAA